MSRMKSLFGYKRGVVISEQKILLTEDNLDCIKKTIGNVSLDSGFTVPTISTIIGGFSTIILNDGSFTVQYNSESDSGTWKCKGTKGFVLTGSKIVFDSDQNQWVTKSSYKPTNSSQVKQTINWIKEPATLDDDKNTLKKQMTGEKVKQLQTALELTGKTGQSLVTGKFWNLTDARLKQLYPQMYTTEKGVTKTLFDKIITPLKRSTAPVPKIAPAGTTPAPSGTTPASVTTQVTAAPNIQSVKNVSPEAYYKTLYDAKLIQGEASPEGDNRVRYKGPELNQDQQNLLTQAMNNLGYDFLRKGNDKRLVYRKR